MLSAIYPSVAFPFDISPRVGLSLAQQVALLDEPAPVGVYSRRHFIFAGFDACHTADVDPEDDARASSDSEGAANDAAREHYVEVA